MMLSGEICNHIEYLFSEVLRFYMSQSMKTEDVSLYILEDDEFNNKLKSVIEQIKRIMNTIMDDVLEQYEDYYLESRKFLKVQGIVDSNQNQ